MSDRNDRRANLKILDGSQNAAIGTITVDDRVAGGNIFSTTNTYTTNVFSAPPNDCSPSQQPFGVHTLLYRLLRPFWIYPRDPGGKSDFSLSALDRHPEKQPPKKTPGEVYVYTMLHAGKGLPCWKPRPRKPIRDGQGVNPGDVGIFNVQDGFRKIFNLWDDEKSIRESPTARCYPIPYRIGPRPQMFVNASELAEGQAVVQGAGYETIYEPDERTIARFEFHHLQSYQQGAVLAMTSAGQLEELDDRDRKVFSEHLSQYAGLIYKYANGIRPIDDDEALYIITGSIKSATWALAAFRDPMVHPLGHIPRLIRLPRGLQDVPENPTYAWRSPGTLSKNGSQGKVVRSRAEILQKSKFDQHD